MTKPTSEPSARGGASALPSNNRPTQPREANREIVGAKVRQGPLMGRSEAEAVPGALLALSDTTMGGRRRALARAI